MAGYKLSLDNVFELLCYLYSQLALSFTGFECNMHSIPPGDFRRWRCLGDLVPSTCMLLRCDCCPRGSNIICRFSCDGGKHCLGNFAGCVGSGICCCGYWHFLVARVARWWTCIFAFFVVTSKFQVESCPLESNSPRAVVG